MVNKDFQYQHRKIQEKDYGDEHKQCTIQSFDTAFVAVRPVGSIRRAISGTLFEGRTHADALKTQSALCILQWLLKITRGVRLAKNDFCSVFGSNSVLQKINCGASVFPVRFLHMSVNTTSSSFMPLWYDAKNDVGLLSSCWIGPTHSQPKWLRTRSTEIRH